MERPRVLMELTSGVPSGIRMDNSTPSLLSCENNRLTSPVPIRAATSYYSPPSMNYVVRFFVCLCLAVTSTFSCRNALAQSTNYVNFEGKQTAPIRLSPDGMRLFAVNTPDCRLSVFDVSNSGNPILIAEIPVGVEPVSVNPLNSDEAWVVNEVSDSISVVSVSRHIVTDTIYVKDEPADVVFAQGKAFVTAARRNEVRVFDVTNHTSVATILLLGENPRSLVVSSNASKVYVAFALSGNRTTLLPVGRAPAQPPPNLITNAP